ncbi:MAG: hypothetical protein E7574_02580 [Ruminococcaceae bacterium]|nr:hypothetical protein [Oscillospiraceae bacterium]
MDKKNNKKTYKHLEEAMFINRAASVNDCTGLMNTPPKTHEKSENLSELLNVPTSVPSKKKNEQNFPYVDIE